MRIQINLPIQLAKHILVVVTNGNVIQVMYGMKVLELAISLQHVNVLIITLLMLLVVVTPRRMQSIKHVVKRVTFILIHQIQSMNGNGLAKIVLIVSSVQLHDYNVVVIQALMLLFRKALHGQILLHGELILMEGAVQVVIKLIATHQKNHVWKEIVMLLAMRIVLNTLMCIDGHVQELIIKIQRGVNGFDDFARERMMIAFLVVPLVNLEEPEGVWIAVLTIKIGRVLPV